MSENLNVIKEFLGEPEQVRQADPYTEFLEAIRKPRKTDPLRTTEDSAAKLAREHFRQLTEAQDQANEFARAVRVASKLNGTEELMQQIRREIQ